MVSAKEIPCSTWATINGGFQPVGLYPTSSLSVVACLFRSGSREFYFFFFSIFPHNLSIKRWDLPWGWLPKWSLALVFFSIWSFFSFRTVSRSGRLNCSFELFSAWFCQLAFWIFLFPTAFAFRECAVGDRSPHTSRAEIARIRADARKYCHWRILKMYPAGSTDDTEGHGSTGYPLSSWLWTVW